MSKHVAELILCRRHAGNFPGRVCDKCDGRCPICDSFVFPTTVVRLCAQCATTAGDRCIICGAAMSRQKGNFHTAFYCRECTALEKDRDGCPRAVNAQEVSQAAKASAAAAAAAKPSLDAE